ncbi:MAG: WD40/YVTN/BNR-like repeat-containing protein, partial [Pyrinomonadaceae bacterium]
MKSNARWMLLFTVTAALFLMLWDFTPRVASKNGTPGKVVSHEAARASKSSRLIEQQGQKRKVPVREVKTPTPQGKVPGEDPNANEDPDLPPFLSGKIDKQFYLQKRAEHISMLRGLSDENAGELRDEAIELLNRQEGGKARKQGAREAGLGPLISTTDWTPLGPTPIPNGQTSGRSDPVSGRTISIAIHPTNPDIVYVGTAQGGLYRSLNGGLNWTQLMDIDSATTPGTGSSLAIGALAIDPSNPTTVFVGTGEPNFSADSFIGRGVFRIRNAETTP